MTVHIVEGDLLKSDCTMIVHQCNCHGTMGAGIAKQIVNKYPSVIEADLNYEIPVGSTARMGKYSHMWVLNDDKEGVMVVNMYSQYDYGKGTHTDYYAFSLAITNILEQAKSLNLKVGLPYRIGAGLAGGNWDMIYELIFMVSKEVGKDVYLYRLD